jgi:hypothetical protein
MNSVIKFGARIGFGLAVVTGAMFFLGMAGSGSESGPQTQSRSRVVTKRPWPVEPVKVISARTKKKGQIPIGKAFDEDDDWLDGFTVTIRNNSDQTVTAMTVDMIFPREPDDGRPPLAETLNFGPRPTFPEYVYRDPNKVIKPGQTSELKLIPENYASLMRALERLGYSKPINRIHLVIKDVGFEDGSVLRSGTWYRQDPKSPHDPTRQIRLDNSPSKARNLQRQKTSTSSKLVPADTTPPNPNSSPDSVSKGGLSHELNWQGCQFGCSNCACSCRLGKCALALSEEPTGIHNDQCSGAGTQPRCDEEAMAR